MLELLRPSQLARRVSRETGHDFTADEVFRAVNDGAIEPHAIAGALPLFRPDQVQEAIAALTRATRSGR